MTTDPGEPWRTHGHYYLAALEPTDGDPHFVVSLGREVRDEELARVKACQGALRKFWPRSLLADLSEATADVQSSVSDLDYAVRHLHALSSDDQRRIEGSLREWLAHFSTFGHHLPIAVSRHFGRAQVKEVKEIITSVKQRDYAYRLAWSLRNFTLHQGNVITDVGYTNTRDGAYELRLGVEPRKLAAGDERADAPLRETAGPIPVERFVQRGFLAAERVLVECMWSLRGDIYERISGLEEIAAEVLDDRPGAQARIVITEPKHDGTIGQIEMYDVPTAYREGFDDFYAQCAGVLAGPAPAFTPEDLARR